MEIPEDLRELVDRLGQALVQALVTDELCRELAKRIQEGGYEVGLMIEATLALHRRGEDPFLEQESEIIHLHKADEGPRMERFERLESEWSEADRAFLQKFKISLD